MILPSRSVSILFGTDANLGSATSSAHRRTLNSCCSAKDLIAKNYRTLPGVRQQGRLADKLQRDKAGQVNIRWATDNRELLAEDIRAGMRQDFGDPPGFFSRAVVLLIQRIFSVRRAARSSSETRGRQRHPRR